MKQVSFFSVIAILLLGVNSCSNNSAELEILEQKGFFDKKVGVFFFNNPELDLSDYHLDNSSFKTALNKELLPEIKKTYAEAFSKDDMALLIESISNPSFQGSAELNKIISNTQNRNKIAIKNWAITHYCKTFGLDINKGVKAYFSGKFLEANSYFTEALLTNKNLTNALFYAKILAKQSKYVEAINHLEENSDLFDTSDVYLYELALLYFNTGSNAKALETVQKASSLKPLAPYYILNAECYLKSQMADSALFCYDYILQHSSKHPKALLGKGVIYNQMSQFDSAKVYYTAALDADSTQGLAATGLAEVLMLRGNLDEAEKIMTSIVTIDPNFAAAWAKLGSIYSKQQKIIEAESAYNRAIDLETDDFNRITYINNKGFFYLQNEKLDQAEKTFLMVTELDFSGMDQSILIPYGLAYNNLGFISYKKGEYEKGLELIKSSLSYFVDNSYAYKNQALIYIAQNQLTKACEALETAEQLGFSLHYGQEVNELRKVHCN